MIALDAQTTQAVLPWPELITTLRQSAGIASSACRHRWAFSLPGNGNLYGATDHHGIRLGQIATQGR
ncbi:hypothetical protein IMCC3135_16535 [Granulosicoccus antarcticus IMCC3135]|uniref:Uncharacterized protein n=1 Tax=Granulosicoccus antarcticus IMCC3135 TaxID=1192854 RepID=A0A2Z2NQ84_9GAMM|nr:hypothetical protein IMCC3135_16535 [Granulosicoccus antarcticus IMCC3135]